MFTTMSTSNKRIAVNTVFLYTRLIFILFVSLYTSRVVLNVLGVVDYGIYNVVAGFVSMFAFLNTSMINSIQRFYNYEKGTGNIERLCDVYNMSVRIQLIIGLTTLLLLEIIGVWYINNKLVIPIERLDAAKWVFQFSAISLVLVIIQIPYSSAVVSHERMNYFAFVGICDAIFKLIIVLLLPYASYDTLITYGFLMFLISVFNFWFYFIYARLNFQEIRFKKGFKKSLFKQIASFSGWNIVDAFAFIVQGQGLNLLMNAFFGPVVNAARGIAYQIQSTIYNFSSNLATAFKPQLVESYAKKDYTRTTTMFFTMSKAGFFMQYLLSIPIIIELDYILLIWLGPNIPDHTLTFTRLVLLNTILNSFNMPMSQTVQATGKIKFYQIIRSSVLIMVLPLSYFALKSFDYPEVVFYSIIIITIILQPLSLYLLHRVYLFSYKQYFQRVILPAVSFAILMPIPAVIAHCFINNDVWRLLITLLLVIINSLLSGWIVLLTKTERQFISSYIVKRVSGRIAS